jgi:flavin reductase (DIM6/NTAB) family NADH-FMN oxidoreductase RutF
MLPASAIRYHRVSKPHAPPDARRFRDTIGLFATGVAVVVVRTDREVLAMTVNAVSSVSLDPMLVMFCPGKKSKMARHLTSLSGFTINILRHDQQALSTYFAGGWKEPTPDALPMRAPAGGKPGFYRVRASAGD